ncbi:MAG: hypothetical protein HYV39_02080 [Candidatus Levybacteria bacterium]|nr:hypothetical protein [Candidatus Levybacteria bacterium]
MKDLAQNIKIDGKPFPTIQSLQPIFDLDKEDKFGTNILVFGVYVMMVVAILLALGFLIWGGISWITSEGDKTKLQSARNTVVMAVIGLIITLLAFTIVNVIGFFFGLKLFG